MQTLNRDLQTFSGLGGTIDAPVGRLWSEKRRESGRLVGRSRRDGNGSRGGAGGVDGRSTRRLPVGGGVGVPWPRSRGQIPPARSSPSIGASRRSQTPPGAWRGAAGSVAAAGGVWLRPHGAARRRSRGGRGLAPPARRRQTEITLPAVSDAGFDRVARSFSRPGCRRHAPWTPRARRRPAAAASWRRSRRLGRAPRPRRARR